MLSGHTRVLFLFSYYKFFQEFPVFMLVSTFCHFLAFFATNYETTLVKVRLPNGSECTCVKIVHSVMGILLNCVVIVHSKLNLHLQHGFKID